VAWERCSRSPTYTYSGGSLVGTTNYFPQFDGNGNVAALVRSDGLTAAVYEYGPFGELLRNEVFDTAITDNAFKFSTKFTIWSWLWSITETVITARA